MTMVLIIINLMNKKWLSHFGYQGHPATRRYSHAPGPHRAASTGDLDQEVDDPSVDWSISMLKHHFRLERTSSPLLPLESSKASKAKAKTRH